METNKNVQGGHGHGRGGPSLAVSMEQRIAAMEAINAAPRGQKTAKLNEMARLLGVHPNTLRRMPTGYRALQGDA